MASSRETTPFYYSHVPKNVLLLFLSTVVLPFSFALVSVSFIYSSVFPSPKSISLPDDDPARKTILVTGVSMTKGLAIARSLAQHTPHRVIGADISTCSPGRVSNALSSYHKLTVPKGGDAEPYVDSLLSVIRKEKVDLWISCSSVVAAVEDGEAVRMAEQIMGSGFKAIQFREDIIERLHEKDKFVDYIKSLSLPVPESHRCTNANEVLDILLREPGPKDVVGRKFILKPIGVDDHARNNMMTLLPFASTSDTKSYIGKLGISPKNPFQVQQFIDGKEYCTHALIIRGRVAAFTSCPSLELLMHYEALAPTSALGKAMLEFTRRVAKDGGEDFTGHMSFDFLVEGEGRAIKLYPIECNPRAHTAVALFSNTPQMASAYLSALNPEPSTFDVVFPRTPTPSYYWIGHDLVTLVILPFLDFLFARAKLEDPIAGLLTFWTHVIGWKDGTYEVWDPLPFLVLYHVFWPVKFLESLLWGRKWSRINVSTTKVFEI